LCCPLLSEPDTTHYKHGPGCGGEALVANQTLGARFRGRLPTPADPAQRVVALQALQFRYGGEITERKPRKVDAVHYGWLPGDNPRHVWLIGSLADLRERHGNLAVRATAVFILFVGIMTYPAGAEDEIKSGNWEYSVTAPGIRELPRGM